MSFAEILEEIPKLSFAQREEIASRVLSAGPQLSEREETILDERMAEFQRHPDAGVTLDQLTAVVQERLRGR